MQTTPEKNFLDMSDDEIQNMSSPPESSAPVEVVEPEPEKESAAAPEPAPEPTEPEPAAEPAPEDPKVKDDATAAAKVADEAVLGAADDAKIEKPAPAKKPDEKVVKPEPTEAEKAAAADAEKAAKEKPAEKEVAPVLTVEQKAAALDGLMTFKANGKQVTLHSPEEMLQLLQMGAGYTKKMQQLQPSLRLIKMLDNNKLTDPAELSYLIDLYQRKPEAIQKLLADSGFDPNSADTEKAAQYKPGAHQVTDTEVEFSEVLAEVEASPTGPELLIEVTKQWDEGSRRALFQQPRLLAEMNQHKVLGLYQVISGEMERRKTLGQLQNVPFLVAYEQVGKELHAQGKLPPPVDPLVPVAAPVAEPLKREPVATRVVTPAPKVVNSEKAAAASAPKTVDATVKAKPEFLSMSDEEFTKQVNQFEGRL